MNTQEYILKKYALTPDGKTSRPTEIPNVGRGNFPELFKELGYKVGVEIGVLAGHYSERLCRANPELKLFCVDSWGTGEKRMRDYHLRKFEIAKVRLAQYNTVLVHKYSMDAVGDFADESLDFVYIDANHSYKCVKEDIREWAKKVRPGGIVAGHDYGTDKGREKVKRAVDEYISENLSGPELFLTTADEIPSWWFIKK